MNLTHAYGCSPLAAPAHVFPAFHDVGYQAANPSVLYFATDGGVYRALNGADLNSGSCSVHLPFDNLNRMFGALADVPSIAPHPADPDTLPTIGFKAIMREAADSSSYAAALSVLVVAEWLYLDWASRAPQPLPHNFVHAEWITLHDNPEFRNFVGFLRAELDRIGPAQADLCHDFFRRAVALELSFFEAAYADRT